MTVVDASVWVSAFMAEDSHHSVSLQWLRRELRAGRRLEAPLLLLPEVGGAVCRRTGQPARAVQGVQRLLRLPLLRWTPLDSRLAIASSRLAIDLRLKGADAVYVAVADRLGVPLISWDTEHLARATVRIPLYTPATAPQP